MPRVAVAFVVLAAAALDAEPSRAQDEAAAEPTAEEMVEVAREMYRPPGLSLSCAPGAAGEIVVCARNPDQYRVTSTIEDAIAAGEPVPDGLPRAPNVFGIAPCEEMGGCIKFGAPPPPTPLIDLLALPHPLTPEEAAHVFRAEDRPSPAEASPAEAP